MTRNEEKKALQDYDVPSLMGVTSCIKKSTSQADNFELKIGLIRMGQNDCQFGGLSNDDPYENITNFIEICDTQKYSGVSVERVRLMIFLSHLEIKQGYGSSLPTESIAMWEEMAIKFLTTYFLLVKLIKFRGDNTTFTQFDTESIYNA